MFPLAAIEPVFWSFETLLPAMKFFVCTEKIFSATQIVIVNVKLAKGENSIHSLSAAQRSVSKQCVLGGESVAKAVLADSAVQSAGVRVSQ